MQTQEKTRILTQLKSLRQQSLSQYLGTNLQSLANRQVIEDILTKFISLHQDEFLTTISNNIAEIKEQYRNVKKQLKEKEEQEQLAKLKLQNEIQLKYEKEMEDFFQKWLELQHLSFQKAAQKNPSKAINKLFDQLTQEKRKTQQKKDSKLALQKELQAKQSQIKTLYQQMRTVENRLNLVNERMDSKQLLNKSLEQQVYQKHMKAEQFMMMVKEMEAKLLNSKEMMTFLQDKACAMREDNLKLKHQIDLMAREHEKIQLTLDTSKKQSEQLRRQKVILIQNDQKMVEKVQSLDRNLEKQLNEKTELTHKISHIQSQYQSLSNKLKQSQNFGSSLTKSNQQLSSQITSLQTKLTQTQTQLSQSIQTNQALTKQLHQKEQMMKDYIDKKDQQIKAIEEELKLLKEQAIEKQQQQKQYEMYLQQIVELREKIKSLTPAKYEQQMDTDCFGRPIKIKNKRTKIYFLLTQIQNKFIQVKSQRSQLTKSFTSQINSLKEYTTKAISMIVNKAIQTKLKCDYCQHSKSYEASLISRAYKTGIAKNVGIESVRKDVAADERGMERSLHSFKKLSGDQGNQFNQVASFNGQMHFSQECQMQKTRQFSYKPSNSSNLNAQKAPQWLDSTQIKPTGSRGMMKNLKNLNQKMKAINQQNSMYQMHLSRILSQSNAQ